MEGEQGRLAWRCRRGMKELDLVLTRYLRERWPTATAEQRQQFERILELPDPELAACLMGHNRAPDSSMQQVLDEIRGATAAAPGWIIRPTTAADHPAILALNEEFVRFLAPLSAQRLQHIESCCAVNLVVEQDGAAAAFVFAMREGAAYDSVNYRWFARRYPTFLYIDRVVVGSGLRGLGVGSALYEHLFAHAAAAGVRWMTCEIDCEPPNPVSERFHARFGFKEVGRQPVPGGKHVSLQMSQVKRA